MPRRRQALKRAILPDPLFRSVLLAKFINTVMCSGKKSIAERIIYGALDEVVRKLSSAGKVSQLLDRKQSPSHGVSREGEEDYSGSEGGKGNKSFSLSSKDTIRSSDQVREIALTAFKKALENVMPSVEVKSRRVGGSTYQVPVEIRSARRMTLAMRWLVEYSSKRNEKTMAFRLANEIMDSLEGRGGAVKKREDVHRMAKANQAFAHYRW